MIDPMRLSDDLKRSGAEQLAFADVLNGREARICRHDLPRCSEFRL